MERTILSSIFAAVQLLDEKKRDLILYGIKVGVQVQRK